LTAALSGVILYKSGPTAQNENTENVLPLLDVPDAFQIEVPDGWQETAVSANEYTLVPGDDSGLRLDIVVYGPKSKKDAVPDVSTAAVRAWAKSIGMQNSESLAVLTPMGGETPRAFASINGDKRNVYVGFFYFKKSFVVATGTAPSDDRAGFTKVERLLWSIEAG
jgi:hypothetical protein